MRKSEEEGFSSSSPPHPFLMHHRLSAFRETLQNLLLGLGRPKGLSMPSLNSPLFSLFQFREAIYCNSRQEKNWKADLFLRVGNSWGNGKRHHRSVISFAGKFEVARGLECAFVLGRALLSYRRCLCTFLLS